MNTAPKREVWQRGPVEEIPALLQPVAHALLQANEEVKELMKELPAGKLWEKPAGVASAGFHLQHMSGVIDRLFTYANGEMLSREQFDQLAAEGKEDDNITVDSLLLKFDKQVQKSIDQLKKTDEKILIAVRRIGREKIPTTVLGLLFHAAEHTMRHVGQLIVTVKVLRNT